MWKKNLGTKMQIFNYKFQLKVRDVDKNWVHTFNHMIIINVYQINVTKFIINFYIHKN